MHRKALVVLGVVFHGMCCFGQVGEVWVETERFLGSDTVQGDFFGVSAAMSGETAIVGASLTGTGSAYAFERDPAGAWVETQELLASDGANADLFGSAVAIDGDVAIVGADGDDDNGAQAGSAYIFERDGDGVWVETAKLLAPDGELGDSFGEDVAVSGDRAIVGAQWDDDLGQSSGSAYFFERTVDGSWLLTQKVLASDGGFQYFFGGSVAIDGDVAVVGTAADAVYVFERAPDGTWFETERIAPDPVAGDGFGGCLLLSGVTMVVGATQDEFTKGAVYILERQTDGTWLRVQKLVASDADFNDRFGLPCAISGDRLVVGASDADDYGLSSGAAYVFERGENGLWQETQKLLASNGEQGDLFGDAVAISGQTIVIGARTKDVVDSQSGAGYVFDKIPFVDPTVTFGGTCPGEVSFTSSFLTPFGQAVSYRSAELGSSVIEVGPCTGVELDLAAPERGALLEVDHFGRRETTPTLDADQCGIYLQVVDLTSCLVSEAVQVP